MDVQTAHTAQIPRDALAAARELLDDVFGDEMTDEDWEHALGGMHALAWEGDELVGHASLIQRRLLHGGRALRTGYVEGVAVRQDHRGRGYGAAVMHALEEILSGAYEIGALGTTEEARGFYEARGWERWRGRTSALTPNGIVRTPDDDGAVYVLPGSAPLDLTGDLSCDWRDGDLW